MATRYDVSAVPPQGGYVAKQCPVRAQWDAIMPGEPVPVPPELERRFELGREFEAEVFARLRRLHPGAAILADPDREKRAEREAATLGAMTACVPLIIGGRLPADEAGRRVGEPDLLVAASQDSPGYRPVDIKHHRTLQSGGPGLRALCSQLDFPSMESAAADPAASARKRRQDMLQLAHYQRMLEAAGLAATDGRYGGIVGVDQVVTWYDLDAPIWQTPSASGRPALRSTMAVYDFEFDFRLDIIAVAMRHLADPAVRPLVVPVRISECPECPWRDLCGPILRAGSGDVSLLPRVGWHKWRVHRDHDVHDRASLASLDHRTAELVGAGVDLRPVLAALGELPGDTSLAELAPGQAQAARLAAAGLTVLGDARGLDRRTASYCDEPMTDLALQIDLARAALGGSPAYRRRGVTAVQVPRGDVEVDIDMENTQDGVYLWGALVTSRAGAEVAGYYPFCTWEPMSAEVETQVFARFWQWLSGLRDRTAAAGLRLRAYCYNAAAENSQLSRLGAAAGVPDEVGAFIASAQWIDLLRVFDSQLITGTSIGLKTVAALAGFAWSVEDPGGAESLLRYDLAVGAEPHAAREWLLAYNRDDTRATLALREWLDTAGPGIPAIEDAAW